MGSEAPHRTGKDVKLFLVTIAWLLGTGLLTSLLYMVGEEDWFKSLIHALITELWLAGVLVFIILIGGIAANG